MEVKEVKEKEELPQKQNEQTKIDLNPETALRTVIKALEDTCRGAYTLQEAELANRAVRFFKKQGQMADELDKVMDHKKAIEITIHCLNAGQKAKLFNLDESSLLLFSLGLITDP